LSIKRWKVFPCNFISAAAIAKDMDITELLAALLTVLKKLPFTAIMMRTALLPRQCSILTLNPAVQT